MEKKPWNYSGKKGAFPLSGTVFATSLEDAQTQVKNMGISNAEIIDQSITVNQSVGVQVPVMLTVGGNFSGTTMGMNAVGVGVPTVAPGAAGFIIPQSIGTFGSTKLPPNFAAKDEEQNMNDVFLRGLNKAVKDQIESTIEPVRRQSLFIGQKVEVLRLVDELLANKNGKVVNVQMRPGHDGYMMFAIVVEHEIKE